MQSDFGRAVGLDFGWDAVLASVGLRFWLGAVGDSVVSILAIVLAAARSGGCAGPRPISDDTGDFAGGVADVGISGDAGVDVGSGVGLRPRPDIDAAVIVTVVVAVVVGEPLSFAP